MPAVAQPLPPPSRFVPQLDLKCYKIDDSIPALNIPLQLTHLNPVLREMGLPPEQVVVREPQELCVPVAKNNQIPDPTVLPFIQWVDLACYGLDAPPVPSVPLRLTHLNPVLRGMGLPDEFVKLTTPRQLCLPVIKNNGVPPPAVMKLVQFIDLKCYDFSTDSGPVNVPLSLTHLNPVLRGMGLPVEQVTMTVPQQLCVPVAKNNQAIPPDVLNIVQWIDLKKYEIASFTAMGPVPLVIRHINPLLVNRPGRTDPLARPDPVGRARRQERQVPRPVATVVHLGGHRGFDVQHLPPRERQVRAARRRPAGGRPACRAAALGGCAALVQADFNSA